MARPKRRRRAHADKLRQRRRASSSVRSAAATVAIVASFSPVPTRIAAHPPAFALPRIFRRLPPPAGRRGGAFCELRYRARRPARCYCSRRSLFAIFSPPIVDVSRKWKTIDYKLFTRLIVDRRRGGGPLVHLRRLFVACAFRHPARSRVLASRRKRSSQLPPLHFRPTFDRSTRIDVSRYPRLQKYKAHGATASTKH